MKNIYKIEDELYIISDKEKSSYCIKECPMAGLNINRCDCQIFTACSNKVGNIILTTNNLLIKDGIQAIDDEFLEWFVKNPSCERVEVENVYKKFLEGDKRSVSDFRNKYKIIIPKEEPPLKCELCKIYPRLEGTNKCESCYSVVRHSLEQNSKFKGKLLPDLRKKQETLEEVAEKTADNFEEPNFKAGVIYGVMEGVKWQQGKMYSEEDMIKAIKFGELYQKSGQKSLFEKRGKTPSQAIENFIKSFNKK